MTGMLVVGLAAPFLTRTLGPLQFLRAPSELLFRLIARAALPALGSIFVALHLLIFDRLFLRRGKLKNL
jgi:hypothetical protein